MRTIGASIRGVHHITVTDYSDNLDNKTMALLLWHSFVPTDPLWDLTAYMDLRAITEMVINGE